MGTCYETKDTNKNQNTGGQKNEGTEKLREAKNSKKLNLDAESKKTKTTLSNMNNDSNKHNIIEEKNKSVKEGKENFENNNINIEKNMENNAPNKKINDINNENPNNNNKYESQDMIIVENPLRTLVQTTTTIDAFPIHSQKNTQISNTNKSMKKSNNKFIGNDIQGILEES